MSIADSNGRIAAVRAFNRFYTRKLGVLDQHLARSPYSLSEARVLYELAHRDELAAKEIGIELGLDPGYLSRIVQSFEESGLITRKPPPAGNSASASPPRAARPSRNSTRLRRTTSRRCWRRSRTTTAGG